ncbi:MAG: DUF2341 domain-containing protein, partial [Chitinispirillaceae bacterium]|nr:DUF2341 domain-containing protein [Chitinispirillaceae bacterium]
MKNNFSKRKTYRRFLCVAILFVAAGVFAQEDYSLWGYSKIITLNTSASGANVATSVMKIPVLIRLTKDNFAFGQAQDDGADIRFGKADGTSLPYEIERWDRDRQVAEVWVLVDTIKGNDSTQSIRMYWGKSDATSQSSGAAVFETSNGFSAVYHVEEERAGTGNAGVYKDATAHHYNGMDNILSTGQEGVIGNGHQFGSTDNIYLGKFDPSPAKLTLSAWVKWNGPNG